MNKALFLSALTISAWLLAAGCAKSASTLTSPSAATTSATGLSAVSPRSGAARPSASPIAVGASPVRLAAGFAWTEGSTSDRDGNIFFVDQAQGVQRILEWKFDNTSTDPLKGSVLRFLEPSGYSNGLSFDNDGNLIDCADELNQLWSIAAPFPVHAVDPNVAFTPSQLAISVLIRSYDPVLKVLNPATGGKLLNGPNDVWVVPTGPQKGGMYIGDPLYPRSWWGALRPANDTHSQQPGKYVYFLSPNRTTLTAVATDLVMPNGVIGTPDGKTLYISDISARKTYSYSINVDGTLSGKKLFCNTGSDGMTIDSAGNVYTTNSSASTGVSIYNRSGTLIDSIHLSSGNVCFGGKNGDILFICANHEIYGVRMKTRRVGPA
jgi:gluconolactonase